MSFDGSACRPVRISKIGRRYLVFDADDVARLRRHHNICSPLIGTTPQNPSQSIFLGLPMELLPEEAAILIDEKIAHIVEDVPAHLAVLRSCDRAVRSAYIESIEKSRLAAQRALDEDATERKRAIVAKSKGKAQQRATRDTSVEDYDAEADLLSPAAAHPGSIPRSPQPQSVTSSLSRITPTTSEDLVDASPGHLLSSSKPLASALYRHLRCAGYYLLPGLRFGAPWTVYPGDPLRFHAHFLAQEFEWDEKMEMLDLVARGRLGTSVKKSFLIGGLDPSRPEEDAVRAFSIEWAGM